MIVDHALIAQGDKGRDAGQRRQDVKKS